MIDEQKAYKGFIDFIMRLELILESKVPWPLKYTGLNSAERSELARHLTTILRESVK